LLTEIIVTQAVKSAVGYGFSEVIKAVFAQSEGLSDREILDQLVVALRRHGVQIGDLDARLARLETLVEATLSGLASSPRLSNAALAHASASVFCRWCGAVPGPASSCPVFRSGHSWTDIKDVYCRWCGAVPGPASACPAFKSGHSWNAMEDVYCRWCGAVPGPASACPAFKSGHSWNAMEDVYCRWCGAVPGQASECPSFKSGHSWDRR
jgi:hypothetical protein